MFTYNETSADAIKYAYKNFVLVNELSADLHFECYKGIQYAKAIETWYKENGIKKLWWNYWGFCSISNDGKVVNLITRAHYWQPSDYDRLREAMCSLRQYVKEIKCEKIVLNKIGEGLDWMKVHDIIFDIFGGDDIEVLAIVDNYINGTIIEPEKEKEKDELFSKSVY